MEMKDALELRYIKLNKALETLKIALHSIEKVESLQLIDPVLEKVFFDGIIQRFEYSIDMFWKFLKFYIEKREGVAFESYAPRNILRHASRINLIEDAELEILLNCLEDRNLTSHTYNQILADQIQMRIPKYYLTMKAIIDRINL